MSNQIIDEVHQHVFESDLAHYNFGSIEPVPVILFGRTAKNHAPILRQANARIVERNGIYTFRLDVTKHKLALLRFPLEPGFTLIVNDVTYTSTRVRYLVGRERFVIVDAVLSPEN